MKIAKIFMTIKSNSHKTFQTMVRETGRTIEECIEKAKEGWDGSEVIIKTVLVIK